MKLSDTGVPGSGHRSMFAGPGNLHFDIDVAPSSNVFNTTYGAQDKRQYTWMPCPQLSPFDEDFFLDSRQIFISLLLIIFNHITSSMFSVHIK